VIYLKKYKKILCIILIVAALCCIFSFGSYAACSDEGFTVTWEGNPESSCTADFYLLDGTVVSYTASELHDDVVVDNVAAILLRSFDSLNFVFNNSVLHDSSNSFFEGAFGFYLFGDIVITYNELDYFYYISCSSDIFSPSDVSGKNVLVDSWFCVSPVSVGFFNSVDFSDEFSGVFGIGFSYDQTIDDLIVSLSSVIIGFLYDDFFDFETFSAGESFSFESIYFSGLVSDDFSVFDLSFFSWLTRFGSLSEPEVPTVLEYILNLFVAVSTWISGALASLVPMFWTGTELTFIGILAVSALAMSVSFLIIGLISRFLRFGG
jgi:hypothetical protein